MKKFINGLILSVGEIVIGGLYAISMCALVIIGVVVVLRVLDWLF